MEWAKFPIPAILTEPGYRMATTEARASYFDAAMNMWMEAVRTGSPKLPRKLVTRVDELLHLDLVIEDEGGISIPWLTEAWDYWVEKSARQSKNAKKRKWPGRAVAEPRESHGNAMAMPSMSVSSSPESGRARAKSKAQAELPGFDRFYAAYPHKRAKPGAMKAWQKQGCEVQADAVIGGLERTIAADFSRRPRDKIPHPATWLNNRGWEDEFETGPPARKGYAESGDRINAYCPRCKAVFWEDEGHLCAIVGGRA
jgi:hypothetical protein